MAKHDREIISLWKSGISLDKLSEAHGKTPTSIASKLVRLGFFTCRNDVQLENTKRGGFCKVAGEVDGFYSIYLIRSPLGGEPVYVGQSQNFSKRLKAHKRKLAKCFDGHEPIIEILNITESYASARALEKERIAEFVSAGYALLNVQDRELIACDFSTHV